MSSPSRTNRLTATGYSVLGLLSLGDWTAYELAQLMSRSVGLILPRAESGIYEEPKRLARLGLAQGTEESRGRRTVVRYRITGAGRRELNDWVASPAASPQLDAETIVKILFHGSPGSPDVTAHVRMLKADMERRLEQLYDQNDAYLDDGGPFPERLAVIALTGRFVVDYYRFVIGWCEWAESQLGQFRLDEHWARSVFEEVRAGKGGVGQVAGGGRE